MVSNSPQVNYDTIFGSWTRVSGPDIHFVVRLVSAAKYCPYCVFHPHKWATNFHILFFGCPCLESDWYSDFSGVP